jgi:ABC-type multidrug transport system ATPase subunit
VNTPVVVAEGLTKRFGDFTAVDGVSFTLEAGEILGYLGPNGSGKTTTLRMLLGVIRPTSGRALLFGQTVLQGGDELRQRVGYMSQRFALYDELTVDENLSFYARAYGVRQGGQTRLCSTNLNWRAGRRARETFPLAGVNAWRSPPP